LSRKFKLSSFRSITISHLKKKLRGKRGEFSVFDLKLASIGPITRPILLFHVFSVVLSHYGSHFDLKHPKMSHFGAISNWSSWRRMLSPLQRRRSPS